MSVYTSVSDEEMRAFFDPIRFGRLCIVAGNCAGDYKQQLFFDHHDGALRFNGIRGIEARGVAVFSGIEPASE